MGIEALWLLSIKIDNDLQSSGITIFETNKIFGGDGQYYYLGTYEYKNNHINANVDIIHYAGLKSSIFGEYSKFNLKIKGTLNNDEITSTGHLTSNPNIEFTIILKKVTDLP